jgi:hypothetical protein
MSLALPLKTKESKSFIIDKVAEKHEELFDRILEMGLYEK